MTERSACVAFVCDEGYLFPTLVAAVQARRHAPAARADVAVCAIGDASAAIAAFAPVFELYGISFLLRPRSALEGQGIHFARLHLPRLIGGRYREFLYLDGDIQVTGDLASLLDVDLSATGIAASRDPMSYVADLGGSLSSAQGSYFSAIGIPRAAVRRYFNSGVVYATADFWRRTAPACLEIVAKADKGTRFPDQDALNMVVGGNYTRVSSAWNFPYFLRLWRRFRDAPCRIAHFMSNPRPWQLNCPPWGRSGTQPYLDMLAEHPQLQAFDGRFDWTRTARYRLQQFVKANVETRPWNTAAMQSLILDSDRQCVI